MGKDGGGQPGKRLEKASESREELRQTWKNELKLGRPWRGRERHSEQRKLLELKKKHSMVRARGARKTTALGAFIRTFSRSCGRAF